MRRRIFPLVLLAGFLALAACAAQEKAAPAPAAPAPAAPAAQPGWEQEWERVLAAAKREGKVAVVGPAGAEERRIGTEGFAPKYGIPVEYLGIGGKEFLARVRTERAAGQYLWDVFITGTTTAMGLKAANALDPLEPTLILPEVKDPKNWRGGQIPWADKDRTALCSTLYTREILFLNTNLVKPEEIRSYKDLLDPKWKGKMTVAEPPWLSGGAQASFQFFYMHKDLGPDYIRALARQELRILNDRRQAAEWLAQGRFPILIGASDVDIRDLQREGLLMLAMVDPRQLKEGGDVSCGNSAILLMNRGPYPNAAKVYINWFLTKEVQTAGSQVRGRASARVDVPTDHLSPWTLPQPGYILTAGEEALAIKDTRVVPFFKEVFGAR